MMAHMCKMSLLALATSVVFTSAFAREVYVDAAADDGGDGSRVRPVHSVEAARDAVRALRASGTLGRFERVDVIFAPGEYRIARSVELDARDGGPSEDAPVVWRAEVPGTVRLVGGVRLPNAVFGPVVDEAVLARLPEEARERVRVADLAPFVPGKIAPLEVGFRGRPSAPLVYVNDTHAPFARWPNTGFISFTTCVDSGKRLDNRGDGNAAFTPGAFVFDDSRVKKWNLAEGVWLHGYWTHDWHNYCARIATYGVENGTNGVVRLACGVPYGVKSGTWGRKDRRFFAFNLLEELDVPGEWYLDRNRKLLYLIPPNREMTETDEVFLGLTDGILLHSSGGKLAHFRLQNLTVGYTYGGAVSLSGQDIQVKNCTITCVGRAGLAVSGTANRIQECEVSQCGELGIVVSGGERKTLLPSGTLVEKCDIHDFGIWQRTYAPGLTVNGCGLTVRANKIHEAPHCAVMYGGNEHLFEFNNVYRVLLETGDAGAYYTGRDWTTQGNILRYNFTHDLGTEGADSSTMGFYFDDCDCGDEVYGNVFWKVACGVKHGGGRDHPIRNNIFANCQIGVGMDARGKRWKEWNQPGGTWDFVGKAQKVGYTNELWATRYPRLADILNDQPREPLYNPIEHNIFLDCTRAIVSLGWKDEMNIALGRMPISGNLVINSCGTNDLAVAVPDSRIAHGFTTFNGTRENPDSFGFVDAAGGDFRMRPGSRILREMAGFAVIPFDKIPKEK